MAMKLGFTSKEEHQWKVFENKCGPKSDRRKLYNDDFIIYTLH
jgi:hypothetical protein